MDSLSETNPPKLTPPSLPTKKKETGSVDKKTYDIFLSYRRSDGSELARYLVEELTKRGFHVFLDSEGLGSGAWDTQLEQRIDECRDFVVVITKAYFDLTRINDPNDIVRKEVARALLNGSNVIPLLASTPPFPDKLPKDIEEIQKRNGVKYFHEYAKALYRLHFLGQKDYIHLKCNQK
jgi:TIR domain